MMKVGVTGGIGSGKTTVCRLFAERGVPVYNSDVEAKRLMERDPAVRGAIRERFGEAAYVGDRLDRQFLADRVFHDAAALAALNGIVHPAVMEDFDRWAREQSHPYVMLESAILFSAGLERRVDRTLAVMAPREVCIRRAVERDGATEEAVRRRAATQLSDDEMLARADYTIVNLSMDDLRQDVAKLDLIFRDEAFRC
ncbi:dephospho-CoA kinase [Alistipes sp.]|jgi:dephospho-coA kinase|uniref:dephospho-CoA kinase n=1 Tax=Alistipes sp. TaxID=1872444 RepID=UPI003421AD51